MQSDDRGISRSPRSILVIGYGNELRGDDALGPLAARMLAERELPGVRTLAVHQLTPELAEPLAAADLALFIDAALIGTTPSVERIEPGGAAASGHYAEPAGLLALVERLYGARPVAYQVAIPAVQFEFGAALSPEATRALIQALSRIEPLLS